MANKVLLDRPGSDSSSRSLRSSSPSRSIASLGDTDGSKSRDWTWERQMTNQLIESGSRAPASVGTKPSVEDQLQFGLLEGKYAVKIRNGKLENIRFVSLSEQPKYLVDRADFIDKYRGLIAPEFEEARLKDHTSSGRKTQETYALVAGNRKVAEVSFELDLQDRLLNFAVHKSEQDQ
ncbi:MAG: FMN-binding protein [Bdellovibrionales bacterium]|nr:FMN-binding protein [Bdellovibrionales bacterium]